MLSINHAYSDHLTFKCYVYEMLSRKPGHSHLTIDLTSLRDGLNLFCFTFWSCSSSVNLSVSLGSHACFSSRITAVIQAIDNVRIVEINIFDSFQPFTIRIWFSFVLFCGIVSVLSKNLLFQPQKSTSARRRTSCVTTASWSGCASGTSWASRRRPSSANLTRKSAKITSDSVSSRYKYTHSDKV